MKPKKCPLCGEYDYLYPFVVYMRDLKQMEICIKCQAKDVDEYLAKRDREKKSKERLRDLREELFEEFQEREKKNNASHSLSF